MAVVGDCCLLNNVEKLENIVNEDISIPIIETLRAFKEVKSDCFGIKADPNYRQIVKNFQEACMHAKKRKHAWHNIY